MATMKFGLQHAQIELLLTIGQYDLAYHLRRTEQEQKTLQRRSVPGGITGMIREHSTRHTRICPARAILAHNAGLKEPVFDKEQIPVPAAADNAHSG